MRKIIILLILASTIIVGSCTQSVSDNKKTAWELDGLKDKVKSLSAVSYQVIDTLGLVTKGNAIDDMYGNTFIKYNDKGKWVEYRSYTPEGNNRWAELPTFDKKGNWIEEIDYNGDVAIKIVERKIEYYDSKNE